MNDIENIELDPSKRNWEYDDTGIKIYKPEVGFPVKTVVNTDNYKVYKGKWYGVKEPYYVDLP